jgi:uroporphyrinogen-III decarboxylase
MNARERYLEANLFGRPDRIPLAPGGARKSTKDRWLKEGLPEEQRKDTQRYAYILAGGKLPWEESGPGFKVNERMNPPFEEKVIEKNERTQIVQDWKGNICEIGAEYGLEYLRHAIDFVTRRWIKCPVENRADWADMKRRYDASEPMRLPEDPVAAGREIANRTYPLTLSFSGPFWQVREWMGFENTCMALIDDPALVHEMIEFWEEYVAALMKRTFQYYIPDEVHISEDMAYKSFSMISPAMCREFLMPTWKRWGEIARSAGVKIYAVDSDGFIGELIPLWIESGLNACDPIEVAAGNDIVDFSRRFGRNMAYRGGIDKRCIAEGGAAIENEMKRVIPAIKAGGFIPGCDHGVPNDVSWPNFVSYTKLLAQATGWL